MGALPSYCCEDECQGKEDFAIVVAQSFYADERVQPKIAANVVAWTQDEFESASVAGDVVADVDAESVYADDFKFVSVAESVYAVAEVEPAEDAESVYADDFKFVSVAESVCADAEVEHFLLEDFENESTGLSTKFARRETTTEVLGVTAPGVTDLLRRKLEGKNGSFLDCACERSNGPVKFTMALLEAKRNTQYNMLQVAAVQPGSHAEHLGVEPGWSVARVEGTGVFGAGPRDVIKRIQTLSKQGEVLSLEIDFETQIGEMKRLVFTMRPMGLVFDMGAEATDSVHRMQPSIADVGPTDFVNSMSELDALICKSKEHASKQMLVEEDRVAAEAHEEPAASDPKDLEACQLKALLAKLPTPARQCHSDEAEEPAADHECQLKAVLAKLPTPARQRHSRAGGA